MPEPYHPDTAEALPHPPEDRNGAPPPAGFTIRDIFLGRDGIRAGWSLLLFLALFVTVLLATRAALYELRSLLHHTSNDLASANAVMAPGFVSLHEAVPLFAVALATWLMAKIERRQVTVYGFGPRHSVRNFIAGLAWGVALLSLLIAILRAAGLLVFDARLLFGRAVYRYGLIWLGGFLLVGLLEEVLTRGYAQFTLTRGISAIYRCLVNSTNANAFGFWTTAFILSFAFGFDHRSNPGESPLGLLSAGLAGFLLCLSLWRTGSLWWAIGFHTTWDWAQSFLYGVPDSGLMIQGHLFATHPVGRPYLSGGLTGPEGSIFLIPVVLLAAAIVVLTLPRTHFGYPSRFPDPDQGQREASLD